MNLRAPSSLAGRTTSRGWCYGQLGRQRTVVGAAPPIERVAQQQPCCDHHSMTPPANLTRPRRASSPACSLCMTSHDFPFPCSTSGPRSRLDCSLDLFARNSPPQARRLCRTNALRSQLAPRISATRARTAAATLPYSVSHRSRVPDKALSDSAIRRRPHWSTRAPECRYRGVTLWWPTFAARGHCRPSLSALIHPSARVPEDRPNGSSKRADHRARAPHPELPRHVHILLRKTRTTFPIR